MILRMKYLKKGNMGRNKKSVYYIKEDKSTVQDYYVWIIKEAFRLLGYDDIVDIEKSNIKSISKESIIIAISHYCAFELYLNGFRNIVYWVQGSSPDESFMRNHSYIRKTIISFIEHFALKHSKCVFMVSNSLIEHFKKKYNKDYSYKTYIMPCFNETINESLFYTDEKYKNNVFCYVGGLSVWQNFPETVDIFKQVQAKQPNAVLKVYTPDQEKAKAIIDEKGINNYSIGFVKSSELSDELASCKFGFIVRSESPVNRVATPTKLSNYMSAGVIPVVSNTVGFFDEVLRDKKYSVLLNGDTKKDIDAILDICKKTIDPKDVFSEYKEFFDKYYNPELHTKQISAFLSRFWK